MDRKFTFAALLAITLAGVSPALAVDKASTVLKDKEARRLARSSLPTRRAAC